MEKKTLKISDFSKKDKRNIILIAVVVLLLTVIFSFLAPLKYRSSSQLLVKQDYKEGSDPYNLSKSTQYISDILAEVVYSSSFFNEVIYSGYNINKDYFSANEQRRKKQWANTVSAHAISDMGIIAIDVYHKDKTQADQIAQAISYILKTKHNLYHGRGDNVSIMIIDNPITSNFPVKPNIIINIILALVFGIALGVAFVYYFPDYSFFPRIRRKKKNNKNDDIFHSDFSEEEFTSQEELYDKFDE